MQHHKQGHQLEPSKNRRQGCAPTAVLTVKGLSVSFQSRNNHIHAVREVSVDCYSGETLAVVGESGSGKSALLQAALGLIDTSLGHRISGSVRFRDQEILAKPPDFLNKFRGPKIGMIFQDPMSALNPTMKIGDQIAEMLVVHRGATMSSARVSAVDLLKQMGVPGAEQRARQYPFEFSGGMLQRAMIALSVACQPELLIADEPTTALDVTIQQQVLQLLKSYQRQHNMALILVTHDLGVVAQMADQVAVMYAGRIVEYGAVDDIFYRTAHPYTHGLQKAMPSFNQSVDTDLVAIPGFPPDLSKQRDACDFYPRCQHAMTVCNRQVPWQYTSKGEGNLAHIARCWLHHADAPADIAPHLVKLSQLVD